jgi:L-asparagine oxygenase
MRTLTVDTFSAAIAASAGTFARAPESADFLAACSRAASNLARPVRAAVRDLSKSTGPAGLLLRGFDIGVLPMTPSDPQSAITKDLVSEFALLMVAKMLGEPVGYLPEHGGQIVQNLVPVKAAAYRQVSTSSAVTLGFHTETAFHPHRPRYLLLLCLRGDRNARTTLCTAKDALEELDQPTIETLRKPLFRTRPDESFLHDGTTAEFGPLTPVIFCSAASPQLSFDEELMRGETAEATAALHALATAVARRQTAVVLDAGDLLVIDNRRAVHGRSPFAARFDGTDRWLQRAFVVDSLAASEHERVGRVITTQFGLAGPLRSLQRVSPLDLRADALLECR